MCFTLQQLHKHKLRVCKKEHAFANACCPFNCNSLESPAIGCNFFLEHQKNSDWKPFLLSLVFASKKEQEAQLPQRDRATPRTHFTRDRQTDGQKSVARTRYAVCVAHKKWLRPEKLTENIGGQRSYTVGDHQMQIARCVQETSLCSNNKKCSGNAVLKYEVCWNNVFIVVEKNTGTGP